MARKHEVSGTREHGTEVTQSKSGKERISALRRIVKRGQYAKIDGVMVDTYSASSILAVYNNLSPANKAKMESFSISRMADVSFKVLAKQR